LRHCLFNPDSDKPWGLTGHDVEDFMMEIEVNADKPRWAVALGAAADVRYEQIRESKKGGTAMGKPTI
jgi:hypothetical protein